MQKSAKYIKEDAQRFYQFILLKWKRSKRQAFDPFDTIMLKYTIIIGVLTVALVSATGKIVESHYEEEKSYAENPQCKPSSLDQGIACDDIGPVFEVKGEAVSLISSNI